MAQYHSASGSVAEDLFIDLFTDTFGAEKAGYLYSQYHFYKEAERNILSNPFKRFEDMQMLRHTKTLGIVQVDESVWKNLSKEEKTEIEKICDAKLTEYYNR